MDDVSKLTDMFFQDALGFIGELQQVADAFLETEPNREQIDRAFRAAHSIKSESSYLSLHGIAEQSNLVENRLEELKSGTATEMNRQELLSNIAKLALLIDRERSRELSGGEAEIQQIGSGGILFNEFEQELIREAKSRGENFYRLYCEIDHSEQMVYPRLFLLINNLELEVNVIKTVPEISESAEPDQEIQIFFTSSLGEDDIYRIISIDQITRVQLTRLQYGTVIESKQFPRKKPVKSAHEQNAPVILRVDSKKFEELKTGIEEIEFFSRDLIRVADPSAAGEFQQLTKIIDLTEHIGKVMQHLYLISVENEFKRLKQYAEQLAEKLGKKVDVDLSGGNFEIDTRFLDILSDVLVHIVRNAVDHGIEDPGERELLQKQETGSLLIAGFVENSDAIFQIIDDGRGIESEDIYEQAGKMQMPAEELKKANLLDLLSHPGFTTRTKATDDSGRGYGLNIAVKKLQQIPGSVMRVVSKPGSGSIFTMIIPAGYTNVPLVVAKHNDRQICFQKKYVASMGVVAPGEYSTDEQGRIFYKGSPVFTEHGRITKSQEVPVERYAVELGYLDRSGFILVDEILFEKEIFEKQINRDFESAPHLYKITLGGKDQEYHLVSPSIILSS